MLSEKELESKSEEELRALVGSGLYSGDDWKTLMRVYMKKKFDPHSYE
jgi:hypothetical protein